MFLCGLVSEAFWGMGRGEKKEGKRYATWEGLGELLVLVWFDIAALS